MEISDIDDELIFGDRDEQMVPPSLRTTAPTMDIAFHPNLPLLAAGLVTGEVELFHHQGGGGCMIKKHLENDFSSWVFGDSATSSSPSRTRIKPNRLMTDEGICSSRAGGGGASSTSRSSSRGRSHPVYKDTDVVVHYQQGNLQMHPYGAVSGIEFTDDGAYLVTSSSDRTISVLDCTTCKLMIHLTADNVISKTTEKFKKVISSKKARSGRSGHSGTGGTPHGEGADSEKTKKMKKTSDSFLLTPNPHKFGISALNICDEELVATGDDDGLVAIWDMRSRQPAFVYHEHGDYISQLLYFSDVQELVSSSGDTCLGVYDIRAGKIRDYSEKRKDEILSFAFIQSSGASSTFVPSILCGTSSGTLPLWKFGSWRRPYDVIEGYPGEVEAVVTFHSEQSTFNHNIALTGGSDGVVRVMEMYPLRRTLCHLSVRDIVQGSAFHCSAGTRYKREHLAIRRERGSQAIRRIRVNHDGSLIAVCGYDAVVDFADVRFLNDEKELDALRRKREQRHMVTLREMEREQNAMDEEEEMERDEDSDEDGGEEDGKSFPAPKRKKVKMEGGAATKDEPNNKNAAKKKKRLNTEDDGAEATQTARTATTTTKGVKKTEANRNAAVEGSRDTSHHRSKEGGGEEDDNKNVKMGGNSGKQKRTKKETRHTSSEKKMKRGDKEKEEDGESNDAKKDKEVDWMEEYKTDRMKKRERAAAARWLKEEKRKKVNFTYEKRRRRVGGFFADLQDN